MPIVLRVEFKLHPAMPVASESKVISWFSYHLLIGWHLLGGIAKNAFDLFAALAISISTRSHSGYMRASSMHAW
jgi:hypothetical protein